MNDHDRIAKEVEKIISDKFQIVEGIDYGIDGKPRTLYFKDLASSLATYILEALGKEKVKDGVTESRDYAVEAWNLHRTESIKRLGGERV